jgi:hypothetical protein
MTGRRALLRERIARHGLAGRDCGSVAAAAALTVAIQAQDPQASRLGIRSRAADLTEADVLHAVQTDRSVTRTWLMRGTIHLVDTADLRWLVRLIGPAIARKYRTRWRQLGLTDDVLERSVAGLAQLLADGPRTRAEIKAGLTERGIIIDSPDPQAHTHAIVYASTIGLLCRGPDRGRDATFARLDAWVPDAPAGPSGDDALAELARRYFTAFSPATPADFTTWSGLPSSRAVALIADELTATDVDGRPGYRLGEVEATGAVRLLAAFDNYLLGYRDREAILEAELRGQIYEGGMIHPAVLVDGRVVGRWALARGRDPARITVRPFEPLPRPVLRGIDAEIADIARFLSRPVTLEIADPHPSN